MISTILIMAIILLVVMPSKLISIIILASLINVFPFHLLFGLVIAIVVMQAMKFVNKRFNPFK